MWAGTRHFDRHSKSTNRNPESHANATGNLIYIFGSRQPMGISDGVSSSGRGDQRLAVKDYTGFLTLG
ncbi:hypothetical protein AMELA_G00128080 [Ameiurus melas]|uniref:Uncharacterized protein n=1 Tax=Ameiurus melas TaxID=219545 RepID=A0A7J6AP87_AMEME|nr:hypothetical protein AMELA_G00128080 [Ameiurus melas]